MPLPEGGICADSPFEHKRKKCEFIGADFFSVGQRVNLLKSDFYIYDADPFTREYFKDTLGIDLQPAIDVTLKERAVPRAGTPPYTGYGSWDDSMSSVINLIPKAPK